MKTKIIAYWLRIVCITIVMIVLARWKPKKRLDKKFAGCVVLDSERKLQQEKGTPKARTSTKKPKL